MWDGIFTIEILKLQIIKVNEVYQLMLNIGFLMVSMFFWVSVTPKCGIIMNPF